MAVPSIPSSFLVQTANGQNLASWNTTAGATSYNLQRSTDNISYSSIATITALSYLDTAVTLGTAYWYKVGAVNGSGTGLYTTPQSVVPVTSGEMSLGAIRLAAQQRADRINSNFVTTQEWNSYINQAMFELYDLLITVYQDYFIATPAQFTTSPNTNQTYLYPLPNGVTSFSNGVIGTPGYIAPPFYKLIGVDLSLQSAQNAWVTINKFNFIDRNRYVYPNTASAIYGVFNLQYRLLGANIEFIPTPTSNQQIRLWYIPRLTMLLQDTDITTQGISGWLEYVIVRAAKYALDKEESDTSKLDAQLVFLTQRINDSAINRDAGLPDTISDVRASRGGWGYGFNGPMGGF